MRLDTSDLREVAGELLLFVLCPIIEGIIVLDQCLFYGKLPLRFSLLLLQDLVVGLGEEPAASPFTHLFGALLATELCLVRQVSLLDVLARPIVLCGPVVDSSIITLAPVFQEHILVSREVFGHLHIADPVVLQSRLHIV